jgi:hypothetical protein
MGDENSYSVFPWLPRGEFAFSDPEKAEALVDHRETQFQSLTDPSVQVVIE